MLPSLQVTEVVGIPIDTKIFLNIRIDPMLFRWLPVRIRVCSPASKIQTHSTDPQTLLWFRRIPLDPQRFLWLPTEASVCSPASELCRYSFGSPSLPIVSNKS